MNIFTFTAAILTVACLIFVAFIYKKAPASHHRRWLILNALAVSMWVGSNVMADTASTEFSLVFWTGLAFSTGTFTIAFYLVFVESYLNKSPVSPLKLILFILPAVLVTLGSWSSYSIVGVNFPPDAPAEIVPGILYPLVSLYIFLAVIYVNVRMVRVRSKVSSQEQLRIKYMMLGFALMYFGGIFFGFFLPAFGEYRFYNLGPQFSIFLIGLTTYAIIRHRLLDIRVVIQKSLVYFSLLSILAAAYILLLLLIQVFYRHLPVESFFAASLLTTLLAIFSLVPLKRLFERLTDKLFFRNYCGYKEAIDCLTEVLNRHVDMDELIRENSDKIQEIFKVEWVKFHLPVDNIIDRLENGDNQEQQEIECDIFDGAASCPEKMPSQLTAYAEQMCRQCNDLGSQQASFMVSGAAMLVPIVYEDRLIGILALGPKKSGEPFYSRDESVLVVYARQCAVAVVKAALYENVKDRSQHLEVEVEKRTAELEQSYRERAQMMIDIAHNLQTPMTVLKSQLERVEAGEEGSDQIKILSKSIDKISEFIRRLLKYATLSDRTKEVEKTSVDISQLLLDIESYFKVLTAEQDIELKTVITPGVKVFGNARQLEELVLNILSNAVKFIGRGKLITIELTSQGEKAVLKVVDTGRGIPKEDIDKLFSRFYRSKGTSDLAGSGLGLAICKRIVGLHDGDISIESELGRGTKVTINLPIQK